MKEILYMYRFLDNDDEEIEALNSYKNNNSNITWLKMYSLSYSRPIINRPHILSRQRDHTANLSILEYRRSLNILNTFSLVKSTGKKYGLLQNQRLLYYNN